MVPEKPQRYAADEEIHHIFREEPRSPPKVISLVFAAAVLAAAAREIAASQNPKSKAPASPRKILAGWKLWRKKPRLAPQRAAQAQAAQGALSY